MVDLPLPDSPTIVKISGTSSASVKLTALTASMRWRERRAIVTALLPAARPVAHPVKRLHNLFIDNFGAAGNSFGARIVSCG